MLEYGKVYETSDDYRRYIRITSRMGKSVTYDYDVKNFWKRNKPRWADIASEESLAKIVVKEIHEKK